MNKYILSFGIGLILLYACAPKIVPISTDEDYQEDLSSTIPEVENYVSPVMEEPEKDHIEFRRPTMDITYELESILDSIVVVNKDIPYFQYTVLVHNSNSRQAADEARKNVYRVLPDAKPKMQFISPSYRVKVGEFSDKIDAYQTLVKLKKMFPNAVIVPEQVYIK